jgi:VWFA-related protein
MRKTRFWVTGVLGVVGAALGAQTFRERVAVEFVRVELIATDGQGRPAAGLRPTEIQIKVDGRPVPIESFEAPAPPGSPSRPAPTLPELPFSPPTPRPAQSHAPAAPQAAHQRYYMAIFTDETSSEQSNRVATYGQVFQFLQSPLPADVEVLLMRFDGTTHVECPWTSDVERLRRCAAAVAQHRYVPRLGQPGQARDPGQGTSLLQLDAMEAVGHVRTSLAGLFDALRVFPEKPGRKALYVVSDGAPFLAPSDIVKDLVATSATQNDTALPTPRMQMEAQYDRDLLLDGLAWDRTRSASLLTDISRLALVRGIEIHPVRSMPHDFSSNVRTDRAFNSRARANAGRSNDPSSQRGGSSLPMSDIAVAGSMQAVAETTGGDAVLSRRALEDGLRREVASRDADYVLAFRDPFAGDHRFHKIEITSAKAGLKLRYRRGYRILDVRESLIQATINRLFAPAAQNDLGVRLQIDSLGMQDGRVAADITIAYPAPPEAGGRTSEAGSVQIIGTCAVRDGRLSEPIDLSGKTESVSFSEKPWLVRAGRLNLLPGAYRFSFAIRDEQTGITSYLTFDRRLP